MRPGSVNTIYALKLVRQLADALLLATRLDLRHYDLRPQNVLLKNVALSTDDVLVLTDLFVPFEKRNWDADIEQAELVAYLSPEQCAGKDIDAVSHVYTLGVLTHHLLAAAPPVGPTQSYDVFLRRLTAGGTSLERLRGGLAPETYELVDRALRRDPRQRYESIEAFVLALEQALLAEELLVGASGVPAATPARRGWGLLTLVVLLALGIVATVTGARLLGAQPEMTPMAIVAGTADGIAGALTTETADSGQGDGNAVGGGIINETGDSPTVTPESLVLVPVATDTAEPTQQPSATPSATPSPTPLPTVTATLTHTPTPDLPTATPVPMIEVALNAVFLRRGPGTSYPQIGSLAQGQRAEVLSRFGEDDTAWFEIRTSDGVTGWLSAAVVELMNALESNQIPTAVSIPPTPTPTATPTATPTSVPVATETPVSSGGGGDDGGGSVQPPATQAPPQPTEASVQPSATPPPFPPP